MAAKTKPQLKSRALVYVPLCQGNHVAAALLDWVLTFSEIEVRLRYKEPFYVYVESAYGPLGDPGPFLEYFAHGMRNELSVGLKWLDRPVHCSRGARASGVRAVPHTKAQLLPLALLAPTVSRKRHESVMNSTRGRVLLLLLLWQGIS